MVVGRQELSPRLVRLTVEGPRLGEMSVPEPAASVRLLVPSSGTTELVMPSWNGNEFLLADGQRPALRTFTPLRFDPDAGRLDLEIVRHPGGAVSGWAESAHPGAAAAVSGPAKGYEIPADASHFLLFGDETALPAISQLLSVLPADATIDANVEITTDEARIALGDRQGARVHWHRQHDGDLPGRRLVEEVTALTHLDATTRIWAAGEAAAMQAIRKHVFGPLGVARGDASIRGYWKPAR